jgi:hypothetical protein
LWVSIDAKCKKTSNYEPQKEYRQLWELTDELDEGILIKCPAAIQFCKR